MTTLVVATTTSLAQAAAGQAAILAAVAAAILAAVLQAVSGKSLDGWIENITSI